MFGNVCADVNSLARILFTLLAFTEDEKARYLANTSSIEECVSSAENWASNREGLSKALDGFDTREELVVRRLCHACYRACPYISCLGTFRRTQYRLSETRA
jgi:hypothetical protein